MSDREWTINLPYPPSVNHLWRRSRTATYLSQQGRQYRAAVCEAAARQQLQGERIEGRLAVDIVVHPPTRAKCDLDNRVKALLDSLMHAGVIVDDSQVDDLRIRRGDVRPGGCASVRIREVHL